MPSTEEIIAALESARAELSLEVRRFEAQVSRPEVPAEVKQAAYSFLVKMEAWVDAVGQAVTHRPEA